MTFLIGRNGEITAEYRGETDLNAMEEQLKLLLVRKLQSICANFGSRGLASSQSSWLPSYSFRGYS